MKRGRRQTTGWYRQTKFARVVSLRVHEQGHGQARACPWHPVYLRTGTLVGLLLFLCLPGLALAQSGYEMKKAKVAGGGGTTTGGGYNLRGTMGEHDAGRMSGGGYTLIGGFSVPQCPVASAPQAEMIGADDNTKNRFVSVATADAGRNQAIRVRFVSLPVPFDVWNGMDFFVGAPREACENSGKGLETAPEDCPASLPTTTFWAAPLVCNKEEAHYMDWHGWCNVDTCVGGLKEGAPCGVDDDCVEYVHLYHEGLVPRGEYEIQVIDSACALQDESSYSAPLTMIQSVWGDVCGPGDAGACSGAADGTVDVTNDVLGVLDKFSNVNNLQKARADLEPGDDGTNNGPDFKVNVANDVLYCLDAFTGAPYPFEPGDPCNAG